MREAVEAHRVETAVVVSISTPSLARPRRIKRVIGPLRAARVLPPTLLIGGLIAFAYVVVAVTSQWWVPYGPNEIGTGGPFEGSTAAHWFGTDNIGRDVFSRSMTATRLELILALLGTVLGYLVGGVLGLTAALVRGWFDELVMRVAEALHSIPTLIFAILLVVIIGVERTGNLAYVVIIIGVLYVPGIARIMRATALELATRDFVAIARTRGERPLSIVVREILPNATGTFMVDFGVRIAIAPLIVGGLGFLGVGIRPPTAEWGQMITSNASALLGSPATVMGPALTLTGMVVGLNLLTDGMARILGRSSELATRGAN